MKYVAIFRHARTEGPGYLAEYLDHRAIPWRLLRIDEGESVPASPEGFSGLVFMGGPMSVNDDLPWIPSVLKLIRAAVGVQVPVLGHCLGGQLMARALGGKVDRNPVKEIGWGRCEVSDDPVARQWFGDLRAFDPFHWHGETFSLPEGAARILSSPYCENQAFALGPHLGLQCHVEMTEAMIRIWNRGWTRENAAPSPSVQRPEEMYERMAERIAAMRVVTDRLYARWVAGLDA